MCVGLGLRNIIEVQHVSPILFSGNSYFRTVARCGLMTSNQNVLIDTTHIKKVIPKLYSFTLKSKITDK